MHRLLLHDLLFSTLLAFASASPIWRHIAQHILSALPHPQEQESSEQMLYHPSSYLDVRPNSLVLSLSTADETARYLFLPVGKTIQTRKSLSRSTSFAAIVRTDPSWVLPDNTFEFPLHPLTAQVIGAVDAEGRVARIENMGGMECAIYPARDRRLHPEKTAEDFAIRFSVRDGVVDLEGMEQPFSLHGREVESYECW